MANYNTVSRTECHYRTVTSERILTYSRVFNESSVRKDSLSSENVKKVRGRKRKATTGESPKNKKS